MELEDFSHGCIFYLGYGLVLLNLWYPGYD